MDRRNFIGRAIATGISLLALTKAKAKEPAQCLQESTPGNHDIKYEGDPASPYREDEIGLVAQPRERHVFNVELIKKRLEFLQQNPHLTEQWDDDPETQLARHILRNPPYANRR